VNHIHPHPSQTVRLNKPVSRRIKGLPGGISRHRRTIRGAYVIDYCGEYWIEHNRLRTRGSGVRVPPGAPSNQSVNVFCRYEIHKFLRPVYVLLFRETKVLPFDQQLIVHPADGPAEHCYRLERTLPGGIRTH